jgi:threonine synthase
MWKAFEEMETLGWVTGRRPKMIAVQASGCAPVAKAFRQGDPVSQMWPDAATFASGLRVPKPYGDALILEILHQSGGIALDLDDQQILASLLDWARHEGLFLSPEGAAATAAYDHLLASGWLSPEDKVVIFNTGAGLKYVDVIAGAMNLALPTPSHQSRQEPEKDHRGVTLPARHRAGGIITPQ